VRSLILAFSGGVDSGKTTISRAVAAQLSWRWGSFGDYVRNQALQEHLEASDRRALEDLGQSLVSSNVEQFVRSFLSSVDWSPGINLVLDGLRHLEVRDGLAQLTRPSQIAVVCLEVPLTLREHRLRGKGETDDLLQIDSHPVERQTFGALREAANLRLDSSGDIDTTVNAVLTWAKASLL
jgi:dephospho-CoA kinase